MCIRDRRRVHGEQKQGEIEEEQKVDNDDGYKQIDNKACDDRVGAHRIDFSKPINENVKDESLRFTVPCHVCFRDGEQNMCIVTIPYFKELVIMSFLCENCGFKSTETKVGGEVSDKARKITLHVETLADLNRDLFKSDTAYVSIPEIGIELNAGTLGGVYTTVEGLLEKIESNLKDGVPFAGDSIDSNFRTKINELFDSISASRAGDKKFTLIIDDPLDNSFIQNPVYPEADPSVEVEIYERTEEQKEELGLNQMQTENYGTNYKS
eukprot:TRINITY_DN2169_c0_g1_i2.p1 TRINITY_DN2169_c0_g1~~TRINITY_DN2169_c0_g1_i2.p1  ORF type:complete len:267 (-),score=67.86 TRINITY_DN2169_c0_g1_i2:103-903(-)